MERRRVKLNVLDGRRGSDVVFVMNLEEEEKKEFMRGINREKWQLGTSVGWSWKKPLPFTRRNANKYEICER